MPLMSIKQKKIQIYILLENKHTYKIVVNFLRINKKKNSVVSEYLKKNLFLKKTAITPSYTILVQRKITANHRPLNYGHRTVFKRFTVTVNGRQNQERKMQFTLFSNNKKKVSGFRRN